MRSPVLLLLLSLCGSGWTQSPEIFLSCPEGFQLLASFTAPLQENNATCTFVEDPACVAVSSSLDSSLGHPVLQECYWGGASTADSFTAVSPTGFGTCADFRSVTAPGFAPNPNSRTDAFFVGLRAVYVAGYSFTLSKSALSLNIEIIHILPRLLLNCLFWRSVYF